MGPRDLSRTLTAAALAFVAGVARAQAVSADDPAARVAAWEHQRCAASERIQAFVDAYARAGGDARAAAERALAARKLEGAPVASLPPLEAVVEALTAVTPRNAPEDDGAARTLAELAHLADALDLTAVPGAFESEREGLGTAFTVHVRPLVPIHATEAFDLALFWVAPDGTETRARREPVEPGVLGFNGFDMYVRSPLAGAGTWRLVAELGRDGVSARGPALAVDCVADLALRMEGALAPDAGQGAARAYLGRVLRNLVKDGTRTASSARAGELLAALEASFERGPHVPAPVPVDLAFTDAAGVEHWLWSWRPEGEIVRTLLVCSPLAQTPDAPLSGETGARWRAVAERVHGELCATHLPLEGAVTRGLLARLRERTGGRELIVIARGDSLARLERALPTGDPALVDALVACTVVASGSPARPLAPLPRLMIAPRADGVSEPFYEGIAGAALPLLGDPTLPDVAGAWIERRAAAAKQ